MEAEQLIARAEDLHLNSRHAEAVHVARQALLLSPESGSTYDRMGVLLHRHAQELSQDVENLINA